MDNSRFQWLMLWSLYRSYEREQDNDGWTTHPHVAAIQAAYSGVSSGAVNAGFAVRHMAKLAMIARHDYGPPPRGSYLKGMAVNYLPLPEEPMPQ